LRPKSAEMVDDGKGESQDSPKLDQSSLGWKEKNLSCEDVR